MGMEAAYFALPDMCRRRETVLVTAPTIRDLDVLSKNAEQVRTYCGTWWIGR
jgi:hypothetical protein